MTVPPFCEAKALCGKIADGSWQETPAIARKFAADLALLELSTAAHILACLSVKGERCVVRESKNPGLIDLVWEAVADRGDIQNPDEPKFRAMVEAAKATLRNS